MKIIASDLKIRKDFFFSTKCPFFRQKINFLTMELKQGKMETPHPKHFALQMGNLSQNWGGEKEMVRRWFAPHVNWRGGARVLGSPFCIARGGAMEKGR